MTDDSNDVSIISLLEGLVEDPYELEILKRILNHEENSSIIDTMIQRKGGDSIA
jgi:hypothetical protein